MEQARIFDGTPTWVFTCVSDPEKVHRLADRNVQVVELPAAAGRVDLHALMRWLGEHDINEVHVEAGARLSGALLQAQCADELQVYMAPVLSGEGRGMARLGP